MRFSFRKAAPRWVDAAVLGWVPDEPLDSAPRADRAPVWTGTDTAPEPRAAIPAPAIEPPAPQGIDAPPVAAPDAAPPAPANINRAPRLVLRRLGIGLAQGLGLFALVESRAFGLWPGSDPYAFAALSLAGVFAPLVLLEGLGEIEARILYPWTGIAAALLASLGLYHHWRIQGLQQGHAGFALALLAGLALVIAQALLRAGLRDGKIIAAYRVTSDTAWMLAARLLVWALLSGVAWALIGSGNSLLNWLRAHDPALRLDMEPNLLILPLLGLASAAAFALAGTGTWPLRLARKALLACATLALPLLVLASASLIAAHVFIAPASTEVALGFALLLVICLNASYRGGEARKPWRRGSEFAAAFLIAALLAIAALALGARIAAFGWTAGRVYAAAGIALLGLYGLCYSAAALIGIGGGRWMQRIEPANRVLALLAIALCLVLCTPLADPLAIAARSQAARLQGGAVDPAAFDFAWLRRDGARFGQDALLALRRSRVPEIAQDAAIALAAPPGSDTPPPTEIGANITVRTPGARLPNRLLERDWSGQAHVPPCLTKPALSCDAWFLDLDGDGLNEILLVYGNDARWWASVMKEDRQGNWAAAATLYSPPCRGSLSALRAGRFAAADPLPGWHDLLVAGMRLSPASAPRAELPCPN